MTCTHKAWAPTIILCDRILDQAYLAACTLHLTILCLVVKAALEDMTPWRRLELAMIQ